ncbi:regulator of chromosome condensation [Hydra vulgaris]|uniref:Regulator of chromosome condensation n=1 Tax=Hydra vulgaris TaxID=6087 RepID=A0ABM4CKV3_HYDVU
MPTIKKKDNRQKRKTIDESIKSPEKYAKKDDKLAQKVGHILTLGQGDVGQLGLGENVLERKRPAMIKEVEGVNFIQVTCGGMHTIGVSEHGEVYSWGCNDDGALGRPTEGTDGEEFIPRKVLLPQGIRVVYASAGDSHSAALTDDGRVFAWGAYRDASGQIGLTAASIGKKNEVIKIYPKGDQIDDPAVKVVSGNDHTVILTSGGLIYTSGTGEQGQLGRIKECFGHRGGRRGLEIILSPQVVRFRKKQFFSDIFAGSFCTFALSRDNNDVYAWGLNNYGQLGSGTTENFFNPEVIQSLSEIRENANGYLQIHGGQHHSLVADGNGKTYSIGRSEYGRLGLGKDAKETSLPKKIVSIEKENVVKIACGEAVSFAVTDKGHLYSWGLGTSLQLGVGDDEDIFDPSLVQSNNLTLAQDEVLAVSAGGQHTAILVRKRESKDTL